MWQPWDTRSWPHTEQEEQAFIAAVKADPNARRSVRYDRAHITTLLNALRTGLTVEELLVRTPGLDLAVLRASYDHVETLRRQSQQAWLRLVEDLSSAPPSAFGAAGKLLPVPVAKLQGTSALVSDTMLGASARALGIRVDQMTTTALLIEAALAGPELTIRQAQALGRRLYDLRNPGYWADPYFLPQRVGHLVPARVARLLDEPWRPPVS